MKHYIIIITLLTTNLTQVQAQNINQSDIDTTCFVISELMAEAKNNRDNESILIYSNTIDKIKEKHTINEAYANYFSSIKIDNPLLSNGIVIFLNSDPKSPGFSNRQIENFMILKNEGITLYDFDDFVVLKKLKLGKINPDNMSEVTLKNVKKLKAEVESITIEN
tara:strand:- start:96 stop:590 length:495 start_codon:yes stop_codon:yes gene_type:complete